MIVFHGTIKSRVPQIMKEGLKPKCEKDSRWEYDNKPIDAIGLTDIFGHAHAYACRKAIIEGCIPMILLLDVPEDILHDTFELENPESKHFAVLDIISPTHIISSEEVKLLDIYKTADLLGLEVKEK